MSARSTATGAPSTGEPPRAHDGEDGHTAAAPPGHGAAQHGAGKDGTGKDGTGEGGATPANDDGQPKAPARDR